MKRRPSGKFFVLNDLPLGRGQLASSLGFLRPREETQSYDFSAMDQACADWGEHVRSTLKVEPGAGEPPRTENSTAGSEQPGKAANKSPAGAVLADAGHAAYANAHSYLDWPLPQLTGRIPELQGLQPAPNQEQLPAILQNMAPNPETGLDHLTTEVTFDPVRLQDVRNPLWLPIDVNVYTKIKKEKYRNRHHYTNYRRYQVSVKIGAPQ